MIEIPVWAVAALVPLIAVLGFAVAKLHGWMRTEEPVDEEPLDRAELKLKGIREGLADLDRFMQKHQVDNANHSEGK